MALNLMASKFVQTPPLSQFYTRTKAATHQTINRCEPPHKLRTSIRTPPVKDVQSDCPRLTYRTKSCALVHGQPLNLWRLAQIEDLRLAIGNCARPQRVASTINLRCVSRPAHITYGYRKWLWLRHAKTSCCVKLLALIRAI